ncbi:indole-3-glycerol phosphate synthase TrpC [Listeria fleischmannii]|uniref:Indole-3-glycerol phosphate synthase n=2 Tax=Listeria fleischmannii TaxID=1069827 RepID=A0A841YB28_9LIST|nr:indole-3-glycerol phosphate synthase TrpC [Listeria fleischmannii]MBC1397470.1 indole-3-glycerol phosphate synthase TrpC [Listeria fleischmannii]MBC1425839.1 indole-3-glycerol phosphate synthase TrpC [Listeria fleischmannii]STY35147.1 Indole-3-glycerol phosphate synthase [Listeria fleischmannii subsp. coloradonensis]
MTSFLEEILMQKQNEVAEMKKQVLKPQIERPSFIDFLAENPGRVQLIAEVKRASPSKGIINADVDPVEQAKAYERAGAGLISVLTDEMFFKGSMEDLKQVAEAVSVPVLCKDFIISEKQLIRARNNGASAILLIVAALDTATLKALYKRATEIGLLPLVEVHNAEELKIAECIGAILIGVNNRNLKTFEVDIAVSEALARQMVNQSAYYISESGFRTAEDVNRIKEKYRAVLVGEALMREDDPKVAAERLRVVR